jgi:hypothetical protein
VFLLASPTSAFAQTVLDPRIVRFEPSADHDALRDGTPVVTSYALEFYQLGASQPFQTADLGKPVPATDGRITVDFVSSLTSWPAPGVVYESRVAAVGPNGRGRSLPSNPFSFSGPCTYSVSSPPSSVGASGASGTLTVTTGTECEWSTSSEAQWITVGPGGTGGGTAAYAIGANTSGSSRSGSITIAGTSYTVTQPGSACSYAVTPTTQTFAPSGGNGSLNVSSLSGCSWTATSGASWITVLSGGAGSSSASVSYRVASTATKRTGSITVASNSIAVLQNGTSTPRGGVALSPAATTVTQPFTLSGWAVDLGAVTGTGVSLVYFYAYADGSTTAISLGAAQYGQARTDIGNQYGAQYKNSGYSLTVSSLAPGKKYMFVAFARSTVTGVYKSSTVTATLAAALTVASKPRLAVDTPRPAAQVRQPFRVAGWAADQAAPTGTGVSGLTVSAKLTAPGSPVISLGQATYGILRNDVAAIYGARYARSGYSLQVTGLAPGTYDLTVSLHSLVTNTVTKTVTVRVTVVP